MSGGAPASSPSKSRVVEAVCIRLCDAITQPLADSRPDGTTRYVSRWRQLLDAGGNIPSAVRDQRSHAASLVQAAGTAQGGSASAAGKAGARRAPVLRAAAASLAEPPFSGRPPPRTPPRVPGDGGHQRTGSRQAPKTPDVHGDNRCTNRRRSGANG